MTHPIDPQTPEVLTARFLWDAAKEGNVIIFLNVWERFMVRYTKDLEDVKQSDFEAGHDMGYSEGYDDGHIEGSKHGYDVGWEEAELKVRAITGERITRSSSE